MTYQWIVMNELKPILSLDRLGMGLSLGCAIHCLLTPLLMAFLPFSAAIGLLGHGTETVLLGASALLSGTALILGFRRHRQRRVLGLLGAALALIAAGRIYHDHPFEPVLVNAGLAFLIPANLLNRRLCRRCKSCHPTSEEAEK
jgi:hypothetical protein